MTERIAAPELIGRHRELAELLAAIDESSDGPRVVAVVGEAGIGKTRLISEVRAHAEGEGVGLFVGRCVDSASASAPYGPFREALAPVLEAEAAVAASSGSDRVPDPVQRRGLLERLAARIGSIGGSRRLVAVIEDMHWSDRSTRDLLEYIAGDPRAGVQFIVTVRSEEAIPGGDVARFLADLEVRGHARRITLGPLSGTEVAQQVEGILGGPPDERMLESIRRRADGNPLYVEELTAAAVGGVGSLPPTLADVILVRVADLEPDIQRLVRICAVSGRRIVHALLRAVAELPDDDLESALRTCIQRRLLQPDDDRDDDAYAFRHAVVQETIYADTLPPERTRVHRRYAETLAQQPSLLGDPALASSEKARHFEAAHDLAAARAAWVEAARAAYRELALPEADACYTRALALPEPRPQDPATEAALRTEAFELARSTGRPERAVELAREAISLVPSEDLHGRAALHVWLSTALWEAGHTAEAELASAESVRIAESLPPSEGKALALISLASVELVLGFPERALENARQARDVAVAAGCDNEAVRALAFIGPAEIELGALREGLDHARRAWEQARGSRDLDLRMTTMNHYLIAVDICQGPLRALEVAEEIAEVTRRLRIPEVVSRVEYERGKALWALGRWPEAERAYELAAAHEVSQPVTALPAVGLAMLHASRGTFEAADALLRIATEATPETHELFVALPAIEAAVHVAHARGDHGAAVAAVERGMRAGLPGSRGGHYATRLLIIGMKAAAELIRGRGARRGQGPGAVATSMRLTADDYFRRLSELLPPVVEEGPHHAAWRALAAAERSGAEGDETPELWRVAALAAADARLVPDHAYALFRQGETLARTTPDRPQALRALNEAHRLAEELGAKPLASRIERLARQSRLQLDSWPAAVPRPDGERRGVDDLTPRERDVLELLVQGASNRQIAESLFITEKTAGAHVSNILAKLGVGSRGEAAAVAIRSGLAGP